MTSEVVALGLPDPTGEGPLAGEAVPMPHGATSVTAEVEEVIDDVRRTRRSWTYHLQHHAIPPRSGNRYHFLVPDGMERWEQVFIAAVRMLVDVDPRVREAVTCRNTLCELTSLENSVES